MAFFIIERKINAKPPEVWQLIGNFSYSPGRGVTVKVLEPGKTDGTGLVREITIGKMKIVERIDEVVPEESFSYSIVKGTPTKSYKGKAGIKKKGNDTIVTWSGDFIPKFPLTGPLIGSIAKRTVTKYIEAVLQSVKVE